MQVVIVRFRVMLIHMVINDLSTLFVDKVGRCLKHIDFFIYCCFSHKKLDSCKASEGVSSASILVEFIHDLPGSFAEG